LRDIPSAIKEKMSRPPNAVHDACRYVARSVNAAGCWTALDCAEMCWTEVDCAGLCWTVLECAELCWTVLDRAGMCWTVLDCAGMCWTVLDCAAYNPAVSSCVFHLWTTSKKTFQARRFSFDRVVKGQGHDVAMLPSAAFGIHYEGRSIFWCASGMLTSTNNTTCTRVYYFAQNIPTAGFAGTPKSGILHNSVLLYDATLLATCCLIH